MDVCLVEELTQIDPMLWADLVRPRWMGVQYILLGDFAQFDSISSQWAGCVMPPGLLQASDMVRELAPLRVTLTDNKRSDQRLFDFYTGLDILGPVPRPLHEALDEAGGLFPSTSEVPAFTLVMSHKRRVHVNSLVNRHFAPPGAFYIKCTPGREQNTPQSMRVWPGLLLIGAGGKSKRGLFYTVEAMGPKIKLSGDLSLTPEDVVKHLRLCHALTYASCQGLTLQGRVRLECDSVHLTLRHLYVGISRATSSDLVEVSR